MPRKLSNSTPVRRQQGATAIMKCLSHTTQKQINKQAEKHTYASARHSLNQKITPQNLLCARCERVAIIVWRVLHPDAWVMIITRMRWRALATSYVCVCVVLLARWVMSCFHRSRYPAECAHRIMQNDTMDGAHPSILIARKALEMGRVCARFIAHVVFVPMCDPTLLNGARST